ncbi:TraR/DksA C4-type zinc finger protein [Megalodesulfovibrio gigas]|uniref:Putative phage/conjugal plasmid C-4 type zinc finger protein, TraR family n=1 Tax=Megalodesulfovibrio gigas (strain ATCC 19364 / DSM 1382 / NCIMB 9332 / VKM B-1759) TaxID=1121448 RepID=T2G8B1_MEGG1|nr:TraR/DksA C4-type zinc finger protein [Megalodesulfovibrio gigas]AGW12825.1 putative phage/conjugal plasmid C-4 type zinc finger protein, TraR family [Megalodesulfovibrio gigas DSM 1382 = ATCC 19364]
MDEADQAQRAEAAFLEAALAKAGGARRAAELSGAPGTLDCPGCIDCGEPIPVARLRAMPGCRRCRDCQDLYESERP